MSHSGTLGEVLCPELGRLLWSAEILFIFDWLQSYAYNKRAHFNQGQADLHELLRRL